MVKVKHRFGVCLSVCQSRFGSGVPDVASARFIPSVRGPTRVYNTSRPPSSSAVKNRDVEEQCLDQCSITDAICIDMKSCYDQHNCARRFQLRHSSPNIYERRQMTELVVELAASRAKIMRSKRQRSRSHKKIKKLDSDTGECFVNMECLRVPRQIAWYSKNYSTCMYDVIDSCEYVAGFNYWSAPATAASPT